MTMAKIRHRHGSPWYGTCCSNAWEYFAIADGQRRESYAKKP